ncbi:MAG: helix-turn-helix domain-containing protein [Clostridiales bacterium]|nr:helix-turn-helix domain-containing protein [Clostridiales bacterium]
MKTNEIRAARIRLGISSADMARSLGVSDEAYRRKERGDTRIKADDVPIIAEKLQLTPQQVNDFIFDGKLPIG